MPLPVSRGLKQPQLTKGNKQGRGDFVSSSTSVSTGAGAGAGAGARGGSAKNEGSASIADGTREQQFLVPDFDTTPPRNWPDDVK